MGNEEQISKALLKTDQHPADDLYILVAMCLLKLSQLDASKSPWNLTSRGSTYALQATVLLETAWSHSKYNFQISLLLIRLYLFLGCGSLAMRAYQRLALKQIQQDTLSYTLFDRISSLHPHSFTQVTDPSAKQPTPQEYLQKQQKLYKSAEENIAKNIWLSLKHGSYNSILEMKEVSEKLNHSMTKTMSVIESRKISRLFEPKTPLGDIFREVDFL